MPTDSDVLKSSTTRPVVCARCAKEIPLEVLDGLCPECFFMLGASDLIGKRRHLGQFEILEEIGRGGTGVVYRARQMSLKRIVALKLGLHPRLLTPEEIARFQREAEIVAQLRHPNIVTVHEAGLEEGQPWLAMEWIDGVNLGVSLRDNPPTPKVAASLLRKIALALAHAHARNILHRDLKPSNVMVDVDGEPHVTDFGLALDLTVVSGPGLDPRIAGTPGYMAPEQMKPSGASISFAADIWSLGAMLYEMLAGRPPFVGKTVEDIRRQLVDSDPVSLRRLNPAVPIDLETICLKCLRKEVAARYGSARELAEDLDRFENGFPVKARPLSPGVRLVRWGRRHPLAATLLGALVLALSGWLLESDKSRRSALSAAAQSDLAAREKQRQLTHQFLARGFDALLEQRQSAAIPWLMAAWENDFRSKTTGDGVSHAMRVESALARLPSITALWEFQGDASTTDVSRGHGLAVAGAQDGWIRVWEHTTGLEVTSWQEEMPVVRARFDRQGRTVAVASAPDVPARRSDIVSAISLRSARNGTLIRRWKLPGKVRSIEFAPRGDFVAAASSDGEVRVWDTATGQLASALMRHDAEARLAIFSLDGEKIVSCSFDETACIWDWRRGAKLAVLPHGGYVRNLSLSPDGALVASASDDGTARLWDMATGAPVGNPLRHKSRVYGVAFSPDGGSVATASSDSTARVWDVRTTEPRTSPLAHPHRATRVSFSPDGRTLMTSTSEGLMSLWNPLSGDRLSSFNQSGLITEMAWLPESDGVISTDSRGLARQWKLPSTTAWYRELVLPHSPNVMVLSPRSNQLLVGLGGATAILWDWDASSKAIELTQTDGEVIGVGYFARTARCWTYARSGPIKIWDVTTGADVGTVTNPVPIQVMAVSPDDSEIAIGSETGQCSIWSMALGTWERAVAHPGTIENLVYSSDGSSLAGTWFEANPEQPRLGVFRIRIWRGHTFLAESPPLEGRPTQLVFSSNGEKLGVSSSMGKAWVIQTSSGRILHSVHQPGEVMSIEFSPGDKTFLTAGALGLIRVWSALDGKLLTSSLSQNATARARFSVDGRSILAHGSDLRALLWDASTFEALIPPLSHEDAIISARFSADGKFIATLGEDLRARIWKVPLGKLSLTDARREARLVTSRVVDPTGTVVPLDAGEIESAWREKRAQSSR